MIFAALNGTELVLTKYLCDITVFELSQIECRRLGKLRQICHYDDALIFIEAHKR